ncbi:uncharacterized protein LOC132935147 [Metopolophium dirhodum]|uniref:uncharacterized protein LOC132935147 n=1 Tax=Metopolophium dirhodum TaxID=44670 RepID=UPI00298F75D9|nr:uncharacterized protein LOC132935147 [Metopolophium dirhodum]
MENKLISNTTESSPKEILNNCSQTNVSHAKTNTDSTEKTFNFFVNKFKTKNDSLSLDESRDSEDSASISCKSIDNNNKKQQQDEMCEASTSYEKYVNVSESNSEELTDAKLVDGKIVSMHTSSPSTALPIMKILSRKSGPHTCLECCFRCKNAFRLLDTPLHICRIRSIEKQNEILKIEPSLCADSCLCDFCWIALENTYKYNKSMNKKEESYSEKKYRLLERYVKKNVPKKKNQARICSIHLCSRPYCHKMSVNEFENIEELFLTFESYPLVFVESIKQTTDFLKFPFCLCKIHHALIMVMSNCQICGDKLNAPFNTDDWLMYKMWNCVLIENKLPLLLKPGMFICATCKGHISKTNPGFQNIDLTFLRGYIFMTSTTRLELYGESQNNLFNICQGSTDLASPIVVPKIKGEKKCVRSTKVKFTDPLITSIYNFENDTESITSIASSNAAEQDLCTTELQPEDEGLEFLPVELSNAIVNPVSIKRTQSNVICSTVSNKDVKKQRLNEKHSSNKNNSTDDNTTKSYKNKNIAHPK